jgi:hypothetical protein
LVADGWRKAISPPYLSNFGGIDFAASPLATAFRRRLEEDSILAIVRQSPGVSAPHTSPVISDI